MANTNVQKLEKAPKSNLVGLNLLHDPIRNKGTAYSRTAAHAIADQVGPSMQAKGMLFPSQDHILETEITTATRIVEYMFDAGLATVQRPHELRSWIESLLYTPSY